jgi:hypothetical protein
VQPGGGCAGWSVEEASVKHILDLKSSKLSTKITTNITNVASIIEVGTTNLTTLNTDNIEELISSQVDLDAWQDEV